MNAEAKPQTPPPPATQTFTRCPGCATVFRVSAAQLALREGQVRCGHCRAVFDANDQRVALDAPRNDDDALPDELAAGRPTVTLRSAEALQPLAAQPPGPDVHDAASTHNVDAVERDAKVVPASDDATDLAVAGDTAQAAAPMPTPAAPATEAVDAPIQIEDAGLRPARAEWKPRTSLRERPRLLYAGAVVLLLAVLGAQALFEYRDVLAAHAPFTRPVLAALCVPIGCSVGPLRDAGALSIDASDLRADPGHRGLLELSATIRNRAAYPIAWPYLELTLTDASDHVVARRAFEPGDYAAADIRQGIAGNGEQVVRLFFDASETLQAGYRLYLFYP
jgi:predicted Zn finger-like uncharacterized protein